MEGDNFFSSKQKNKKLTQELKTLLAREQIIDDDRQLISIQLNFPQILQVVEDILIQIFEL